MKKRFRNKKGQFIPGEFKFITKNDVAISASIPRTEWYKQEIKTLEEDIEETILRLHVHLINLAEKNKDFEDIEKFAQGKVKKGLLPFKIKITDGGDDRRMREYREYIYYKGKFMAYLYVLEHLGSDVPAVLKRLRGIKIEGNEAREMKIYRTENYGHYYK